MHVILCIESHTQALEVKHMSVLRSAKGVALSLFAHLMQINSADNYIATPLHSLHSSIDQDSNGALPYKLSEFV